MSTEQDLDEIACCFCGLNFSDEDSVKEHVKQIHSEEEEDLEDMDLSKVDVCNFNTLNSDSNLIPELEPVAKPVVKYHSEPPKSFDSVVIYDSNMHPHPSHNVDLTKITFCKECSRHFINEDNLRQHQLVEHNIRKRKRPINDNEVTGVIVTADGKYACQVCGKIFEEKKQAKVHKFKSHDEPRQKQENLQSKIFPQTLSKDFAHRVPISPYYNQIKSEPTCINNNNRQILNQITWQVKGIISPSANHRTNEELKVVFARKTPEKHEAMVKSIQEPPKTPVKNFHCAFCSLTFTKSLLYQRHVILQHRGSPHVCETCRLRFVSSAALSAHKSSSCSLVNSQTPEQTAVIGQCGNCHLEFVDKRAYNSHCLRVCKTNSDSSLEKEAALSDSTEATEGATDFSMSTVNNEENSLACQPTEKLSSNIKGEETNIKEEVTEDCNENDEVASVVAIIDFVNNPVFVYKSEKYYCCNLCNSYLDSLQQIQDHLQHYHRIANEPHKIKEQKLATNNIAHSFIEQHCNDAKHNSSSSSNCTSPTSMSTYSSNSLSTSKRRKFEANSNGEFECEICQKKFGCRSSLSNHSKSHFNHNNRPHKCNSCNEGFMSPVNLQEHRDKFCKVIHGDKALKFNSALNLSSRSLSSGGSGTGRVALCLHCQSEFADKSMLEDHAARHHSNDKHEIVCVACTRCFNTYMAFKVHMTKTHNDGSLGSSKKKDSLPTMAPPTLIPNINNTSISSITKHNTSTSSISSNDNKNISMNANNNSNIDNPTLLNNNSMLQNFSGAMKLEMLSQFITKLSANRNEQNINVNS